MIDVGLNSCRGHAHARATIPRKPSAAACPGRFQRKHTVADLGFGQRLMQRDVAPDEWVDFLGTVFLEHRHILLSKSIAQPFCQKVDKFP